MRVVTGIQCFYVVIFIIQSKAKSSSLTPTSTPKILSTTISAKSRSPSSSPSLTQSSPTTGAINATRENNGLSSWWTRSTIKPSSATQPNTASSSLQDSSSSVYSKSTTNIMTSIPSASLALTSTTSINEYSSTTQPNTASSSLQDSSSSVYSKSTTNIMTSIPSASLALKSATSINEYSPTTQPNTDSSGLQDSSSSVHSKSSTNIMAIIPSASLALTSATSVNEYSPTTQPNTDSSSLHDSSSSVHSKSSTNIMAIIPSASLALTSATSVNEYSPTTQPNTDSSGLQDSSSSVYSKSTTNIMAIIPSASLALTSATSVKEYSSTTQPNTASSSLQDSSSSVDSKSSTNIMAIIPSASLALTSATSVNEYSSTTQPNTASSSLQDSSSSVYSKSTTNIMAIIPSASLALTSATSINEYSSTTQPNTASSSLQDSSSSVYSKSTTNIMAIIPSASLALTSATSVKEYSSTTQPNTASSSLQDSSSSVYSTSAISNRTSIPDVPFASILGTTTYEYHSSIKPIRTSSSLQASSSLVYSTSTRSIITIPNVTLVPKSATTTYYSSSTIQQNTTSTTAEFRTTQKPTKPLKIIYIIFQLSMTIINIEVHKNDECGHDAAEKVSELLSTCNSLKIEDWSHLFYEYLLCKMCSVDGINKDTCSMEIIDLRCGSVITTINMIVRVNNTESSLDDVNNIFKRIKQEGKIKELLINSTSFNFTNQGEVERTSSPTPTLSPDITIVEVKINYNWPEFCRIRDIFKSEIAASCEPEGEKLNRSDIYILGEKRKCSRRPDDVEKSIVVQFYVLKNNANKKTLEVYDCLKNKFEQGKLDLGNFFNDKIVSIGLKDEHVPTPKPTPVARTLSDGEKVWLAVGLTLAILLLLLVLYLCCCRRKTNEDKDAERGSDHFVLDNIDGTKKESVVLVNDGFDSQEDNDPPNSLSTFKGKEPDKPLNGDIEEKKAPLGDGEETDDELGMTVPDVAIEEPEKSKSTPTKAPPHMATTDLAQEKREFEDLNQTKADPAAYPIKDSDKNRVPSIVPNPDTRVTLKGENDYINANFIKDHQGNKAFIATQHPLSNTMRDFWSMVWQHDVEVIVMVNNDEKNTADYHNYWMNQKNSLAIHGHMQVKTEEMQKMDAFNITTFTLKNSQENAVTKTVQHFRFTNWPNQDVPDVKEFIHFMKMAEKATSKNVKSPVVVHCSDGQGYTGVFIAVAIGSRVYEESGKKSIVDVFDCVNKMRSDRNQIVSSKELFAYIYKVFEDLTNSSNISDSRL
ncbi:uncharacterized protein LOC124452463 isoform X2 [Xenia sp. Carnegie-2017]|uniref:uncharacterized protein LOC124452463 isoform X2 n=1 Tax=Xenia sp. Carnegie-2017 TaxID=2897299 RepID=UPI001F040829|nr:uncharacterized protein LOC124452463 isoform X2 [Xenia sp. Carnegie-2017]